MRTTLLTILAAMVLLTGACSDDKKDGSGAKLASLCTQAGEQLAKDSTNADDETFQLMLQNALTACSGACDAKDEASCKALEGHVAKICGVSASVCEGLCSSVKSPSLKKASCEFKKP